MKNTKMIWLLCSILVVLIGCSEKLSDQKNVFEGQGTTYSIQLPSPNWEKETEKDGEKYGLKTSFSAADKRSNSYMFVSVTPVNEVKYNGFAEETRKKLSKRYGYEKEKDVYMKEFKIKEHQAIKYTVSTTFNKKPVWAHLYYIWEENEFVQLVYYSADDNKFKDRSLLIQDSVETLKETNFDVEKAEDLKKQKQAEQGDTYKVENEQMVATITAVRKIPIDGQKDLFAVRYTFTNLSKEATSPDAFISLVKAKQNKKEMISKSLPENTSFIDVKELEINQKKKIEQGSSIDSVVFFELEDSSSVEISFSQEAFPETKPTIAVVPK